MVGGLVGGLVGRSVSDVHLLLRTMEDVERSVLRVLEGGEDVFLRRGLATNHRPVSYTHSTLPTQRHDVTSVCALHFSQTTRTLVPAL